MSSDFFNKSTLLATLLLLGVFVGSLFFSS